MAINLSKNLSWYHENNIIWGDPPNERSGGQPVISAVMMNGLLSLLGVSKRWKQQAFDLFIDLFSMSK